MSANFHEGQEKRTTRGRRVIELTCRSLEILRERLAFATAKTIYTDTRRRVIIPHKSDNVSALSSGSSRFYSEDFYRDNRESATVCASIYSDFRLGDRRGYIIAPGSDKRFFFISGLTTPAASHRPRRCSIKSG